MTELTMRECSEITGGATYVTCPICGYQKKWTLLSVGPVSWLCGKKRYLFTLQYAHVGKIGEWSNSSRSVHK